MGNLLRIGLYIYSESFAVVVTISQLCIKEVGELGKRCGGDLIRFRIRPGLATLIDVVWPDTR